MFVRILNTYFLKRSDFGENADNNTFVDTWKETKYFLHKDIAPSP